MYTVTVWHDLADEPDTHKVEYLNKVVYSGWYITVYTTDRDIVTYNRKRVTRVVVSKHND